MRDQVQARLINVCYVPCRKNLAFHGSCVGDTVVFSHFSFLSLTGLVPFLSVREVVILA